MQSRGGRDIMSVVMLRTERLRLRPFRPGDLAAFERFAESDEYRRFLDDDHPDPVTFLANNLGVDGAWVIERDERIVGSIFLGEEIACLLDPSVHGMGIATEAARIVIADGFERRHFDEIVARARTDNVASLRAIARLGFCACDDGTYRLRRSDWEGQA
jgi:ribosomal-protein-alanine N-acetyltransferase